MRNRILALLLTFLVTASAHAQPGRDGILKEIQQAYRDLDYEAADRKAREALGQYGEFTVQQLTDLHTVVGLIAYNRSDFLEARRQFISALQLSPELKLDPLVVPPKILAYFGSVKSELQAGGIDDAQAVSRYVFVGDPRRDAVLRSMVLPGWGQLYKGHKIKGWVFSGAWATAIGGALWAHRKRADAEEFYEAASDTLSAVQRYPRFNRWHKARNGLVQGAALVWVVSYVDALLTGSSISDSRDPLLLRISKGNDAQMDFRIAPQNVSLTVTF
jgi:hypothetical protein